MTHELRPARQRTVRRIGIQVALVFATITLISTSASSKCLGEKLKPKDPRVEEALKEYAYVRGLIEAWQKAGYDVKNQTLSDALRNWVEVLREPGKKAAELGMVFAVDGYVNKEIKRLYELYQQWEETPPDKRHALPIHYAPQRKTRFDEVRSFARKASARAGQEEAWFDIWIAERYKAEVEARAILKRADDLDLPINLYGMRGPATVPNFLIGSTPTERKVANNPYGFVSQDYRLAWSYEVLASSVELFKAMEGRFDAAMKDLAARNGLPDTILERCRGNREIYLNQYLQKQYQILCEPDAREQLREAIASLLCERVRKCVADSQGYDAKTVDCDGDRPAPTPGVEGARGKRLRFGGTIPTRWQGGAEAEGFHVSRQRQTGGGMPRDCAGEAAVAAEVHGTLRQGSATVSEAEIVSRLEGELADMKRYLSFAGAQIRPLSVPPCNGSLLETRPRVSGGSGSPISGYRDLQIEASAHGFAVSGNTVIELSYSVVSSGCWNQQQRPWQEAALQSVQAEAQAIVASLRLVEDGGFTTNPAMDRPVVDSPRPDSPPVGAPDSGGPLPGQTPPRSPAGASGGGSTASRVAGSWTALANGWQVTIELRLEGGALAGTFSDGANQHTLIDISFAGDELAFTRPIPGLAQRYTGTITDHSGVLRIAGSFTQEGSSEVYAFSGEKRR